ncbi:hypothetical protein VTK73DRAFT_5746 [Phialemonium thermophilum]|uniref:Gfo/Idh/MocA-like oxidoreductase C-terminal domain-containing protein n=1 Tax=Phialemonium thermophilum TaxID=223376 RepID=A0ABR3V254_9PEZI
MYLEAEREDGYHRDQNVFGDGISIEDTMAVLVRYKGGALLSYSLTAYAPWEGFRVSFTGTQGRLEVEVVERSYVSAAGQEHVAQSAPPEGSLEGVRILVRPHFGPPREETVETKEGGHGGGDPELLRDLFGGDAVPRDELKRAASHVDGALSILTGIAANQSIRTGLPVKVDQLVQIPYAEMV